MAMTGEQNDDLWHIVVVLYNMRERSCIWITDPLSLFTNDCKMIQVGADLLVIQEADPIPVFQVSGLCDNA